MERAGPGDALGVLAVEVQAARNLAAEGSPVTHQPRIEGRRQPLHGEGQPAAVPGVLAVEGRTADRADARDHTIENIGESHRHL